MKIIVTADIHYGVGNNQHIVKQCGFHYLDQEPFIREGVGFVGSIGWYDYSFKDLSIPIPESYFLNKTWPFA